MKVFIAGGTGFIGRNLSKSLLRAGHEVIATGTRPVNKDIQNEKFHYISADTTKPGKWQDALSDINAVVNLAGRTIFHYWTKSYKKNMYDSRILTTRNLTNALPEDQDIVLCSTSAVGYYGNTGNDLITEESSSGKDFLAILSKDWETEAFHAEKKGIRVAAARFGIVLGKNGGAIKQMLPAFLLGAGGPLGNGKQWFPWIHIDDLVSAIIFIIENKNIKGPVNFTAPGLVKQKDFAKTLGTLLHRPAFLPAPGLMIRLVMGELGNVLLTGQRAMPEKLLKSGFPFQYPDIYTALEEIL